MIVDTSAIVAILRDEPETRAFADAIANTSTRLVSAINYVEAAAVIDGARNPVTSRQFEDFFREARLVIERETVEQAPHDWNGGARRAR